MGASKRGRTRRTLGLLAVAMLATVSGLAAPAAAQEYPPTPDINTPDPLVPEGGIVTINGSGYLPNAFVCLCILNGPANFAEIAQLTAAGVAAQSQEEQAIATCQALGGTIIGTTTSDANGNWTFPWDTTRFPPGSYTIAATDGTNTLAIETEVTPPVGPTPTTVPGPVDPSLPQTGGVAQGPLRVGALLLAAGGLVLLAVRNRRPTAHARS